jgi:hypothetical protein
MSFTAALSRIVSAGASSLVDSIGNAIDRNITSDEERLKIEAAVQKELNHLQALILQANSLEQEQLTKRLQSDNRSDNWLSKNIRPLSLIFVTAIVSGVFIGTVFGELDESQVEALQMWIDLWTAVMMTMFGFYFGSRGLEKISDAIAKKGISLKRGNNYES